MPLQKQNSNLRVLTPLSPDDAGSLDELLGPGRARPADLLEPFHGDVPVEFRRSAAAAGVPLDLAVMTVIERSLALALLGDRVDCSELDARARAAQVQGHPSRELADYIRGLVAVLQRHRRTDAGEQPALVPIRVADRLRASGRQVTLGADAIESALRWELAAAIAGLTITEWTLAETLRG
jgi:hypothetical protein